MPDYTDYFKDFVDPNYARLFKGEWTSLQVCCTHIYIYKFVISSLLLLLQVSFEAVDPCDRYPLGVKTTYRAYSKVSLNIPINVN